MQFLILSYDDTERAPHKVTAYTIDALGQLVEASKELPEGVNVRRLAQLYGSSKLPLGIRGKRDART